MTEQSISGDRQINPVFSEAGIARQLGTHPEQSTQLTNPWQDSPFGSLSGGEVRTLDSTPSVAQTIEVPQVPIVLESNPHAPSSESKPAWQITAERKLAITEAQLDVRLNGRAIANILKDHQTLLPRTEKFLKRKGDDDGWYEERDNQRIAIRQADLEATLEAIAALPEKLDFKPGITLIVGENGLGKSTLARALQMACKAKDWSEDESSPNSYEKSLEQALESQGLSGEPQLGGLTPYLAQQIQIDGFASAGHHQYYDISMLIGQSDQDEKEHSSNARRRAKKEDLSYGSSHRQYLDKFFNSLKKEKVDAESKGDKRHRGEGGPQIYFFDEPETGMSPARQASLANEIEEATIDNSIVIVPTNSMMLYMSDLPRINLKLPDLGIHKPSEHPDKYADMLAIVEALRISTAPVVSAAQIASA